MSSRNRDHLEPQLRRRHYNCSLQFGEQMTDWIRSVKLAQLRGMPGRLSQKSKLQCAEGLLVCLSNNENSVQQRMWLV